MIYENIVLNHNLSLGFIKSFEKNDTHMVVVFKDNQVGKTLIGSNQYRVRVDMANEIVRLLDVKDQPLQLHASSLANNKLTKKALKAALINEKQFLLKRYQDACKTGDLELIRKAWEPYTEVLKLV